MSLRVVPGPDGGLRMSRRLRGPPPSTRLVHRVDDGASLREGEAAKGNANTIAGRHPRFRGRPAKRDYRSSTISLGEFQGDGAFERFGECERSQRSMDREAGIVLT
jgi:hypothetical protein